MAELVPLPFPHLVTRVFREFEERREVFHLPERKFVRGLPGKDLSVPVHGRRAASPLGPAAGPHSQLAQNIVLAWLGGGRVIELKTVQVLDRLRIPRPCIDVETIGYNVEWSQELTLEESLEEYVKASMLVEMLAASGLPGLHPGFDRAVFDMSVGYDLEGIRGERVQAFVRGLMDATPVVDRLRRQVPSAFRHLRDLDFMTRVSDSLTLSTFHGCPPDEIERIARFLLDEVGLHTVVKLNPTLLGRDEVRRILQGVLGYPDEPPDDAFAHDPSWEQATEIVSRLAEAALAAGRGFGVKLTNTLIVRNHRSFFPATEKVMYLSGQPLHVIAVCLLGRFRDTFGDTVPVSFSAGIDARNFPDAVSLGLVPVTVCTDLLRPGGYGRMEAYFRGLEARMDAAGARTIDDFVIDAQGQGLAALDRAGGSEEARVRCQSALADRGDLRAAAGPDLYGRWVSEARALNTRAYVDRVLADPRYTREATRKPPKKVGSRLSLFDCLSCDKCLPACPNAANFTYEIPATQVALRVAQKADDGSWAVRDTGSIRVTKGTQIANFADACNECGNCDVFCPEDGGPYVLKPRFFGSAGQFALHRDRDGFFVERVDGGMRVLARFDGQDRDATFGDGRVRYSGDGFDVSCDTSSPSRVIGGRAEGEVDLGALDLMRSIGDAVLRRSGVNPVSVPDGGR